jgi:hypothetical protein
MKKIRNKKAWLRVVEACIATLILIGFVMIIMNKVVVRETNMQEKANEIILKIEKNDEIRALIFGDPIECLIIKSKIEAITNFNFAFDIGTTECLDRPEKDIEVFASSIFLTSSDNYKKFTLYIWK